MRDAEQRRHEKQRGTGSEEQAADNRATERRVLPGSIAIGAMPMIIASAVISTGRNRVKPASRAAVSASAPAARRSRAKLMTRMLFAVATPMHMIAPVSAGTERVVPVANSIQTMPASAVGKAITIT